MRSKRQMNYLWKKWVHSLSNLNYCVSEEKKRVGHLHFVVAVNALQRHCCIGLLFSPAVNSFNYYLLLFICLCSVVYVDFWRLHFMCVLTVLIVVVLLCTFVCFPIDCAHDARSTAAQQQQRSNNNNNSYFNFNCSITICISPFSSQRARIVCAAPFVKSINTRSTHIHTHTDTLLGGCVSQQ